MPPRARKERVIDPAKIVNLQTWLEAYQNGYKNVKMGPNGELQIYDTDILDIVKTIPHLAQHDSELVLASGLRTPLYEKALLQNDAMKKAIHTNAHEAQSAFIQIEKELLQTIEQWESADKSEKPKLAMQIGEFTQQLQEADTQMRTALNPYRHIKSESIPKMFVNYASKDPRMVFLFRTILQKTDPSQAGRHIIEEGTV